MIEKVIAENLLGSIHWHGEKGYCKCPGEQFHTSKNGKKDCVVYLDKVPTITCLHTNCSSSIEDVNYKFRRALWENKPGRARELTSEEKKAIRLQIQEKKREEKLIDWADNNKSKIFEKHFWPIADVFHESPFYFEKEECHFDAMLSMFGDNEILWMGEPMDSGEGKQEHFKSVKDWRKIESLPYHFTCPSTFKPGSFSRSNENVLSRPYLVIESDTLTLDETCSIFKWMRSFMKLTSIVFTGGKSMHGWFKFPSLELFEKLKVVLPAMGCDKALFKPSQPVRMPGIMRGDKWQSIYWLDKI